MVFYYDIVEAASLKLYIIASEKGLSAIHASETAFLEWNKPESMTMIKDTERLNIYTEQIKSYLLGERKSFDLPIDLQTGTAFQRAVWEALQEIPYGTTVSYADIAVKINNPKAVRAIGNANGANPIPIVIPCHRVIQKDGSLGGYSSGLLMKKTLLALEQADK